MPKKSQGRWGNCPVCNTYLPWPKEEGQTFNCCWQEWYVVEWQGNLYWEEGGISNWDDE